MLESQVFVQGDLALILRALALTLRTQPAHLSAHDAAYRRGYADALTAVAIAIGMEPEHEQDRMKA